MKFPWSHAAFVAVLAGLFLTGCETTDKSGLTSAQRKELAALKASAKAEHTLYRSIGGWKKNTYRNKALLEQATPENIAIEISLKQQRGVLLVKGALAMDFPVATGKASHPTPIGSYTVRGKEKNYHSNLYGKVFDATGAVVIADADSRTMVVPEGAKFVGASMPYWMRLTDSGVGLHVGYVAGVPASHGCVRLKTDTAKTLFDLVKVGTPVLIAEEIPSLSEPPPAAKKKS